MLKRAMAAVVLSMASVSMGATLTGNVISNAFVQYDPNGYTGVATYSDSHTGEEDYNSASDYLADRTVYKLELPALPAGQAFSSATFNYNYLTFANNNGTPAADFEDADIVYYEPTSSSVGTSDFFDTTNAVTFADQLTGTTATGEQTLASAALNSAIANAYTEGRTFVAFRLQLDGALDDGQSSYEFYDTATPQSASDPNFALTNLEVNTVAVPEPASISLLGLGALGLLRRRRNAI